MRIKERERRKKAKFLAGTKLHIGICEVLGAYNISSLEAKNNWI